MECQKVPSKNADDLTASIAATPGERVTREGIEARIRDVVYTVLPGTPHSPGERVTICQIVLDNGFDVRGQAACVDPANFDRALGQRIAFDDAFRQLWPLFGFLLAERRHLAAGPRG